MSKKLLATGGLLLALLIGLGAAAQKRVSTSELAREMRGLYKSTAHYEGDTASFDLYLSVRLLPAKGDTIFLLVEQAVGGKLNEPYGRLVYRLEKKDKRNLMVHIHQLKPAFRHQEMGLLVTDWKKRKSDLMLEISRCVVQFYKNKFGMYCGATEGVNCLRTERKKPNPGDDICVGRQIWKISDPGWDNLEKQLGRKVKPGYLFTKIN